MWPDAQSTGRESSAALADQPLQMFDQRGNRALDHIEHLRVRRGWSSPRVGEVFVSRHGERVPSAQQLDLHRLDGGIEAAARLLPTAQPFEIGDIVAIHGDDQVAAFEIVGMNLAADVTDVIATQATLVRCQRVGKVADVVAAGRCRVESEVLCSALPGHMNRDCVSRW